MRLTRTQRRTAAIVASAGVIAALSAPGSVATPTSSASLSSLIDQPGSAASTAATDSRVGALVRPTQAQVSAVRDLVTARAGTKVGWDLRFGTPRMITPTIGSRLTGPSSASAVAVAASWLTTNRAMLGLSAADVHALLVRRDHVLPENGTHVISFTQTFSGVPAARGGSLGVAVDSSGRVLNYTGETIRSSGLVGSYSLTTAQALKKVATALAPTVAFSPVKSGTAAGYDSFERGPFSSESYVKKVAFPTASGARAAYSVLFIQKLDQAFEVVVDAATGVQLYQHSLVAHEDDTSGGTIYPNRPGAAGGGTPVHVSFGTTAESPDGYVDPTGVAGVGVTTFGNNANSHANWSNFIAPVDPGPRPVSPTGQFDYNFADHWGTSNCSATAYPLDQEPATTNLFYQHNRIHDEFYHLGFTESAGNFQVNNYGKGGQPGDSVIGLVQAGAASGGSPTYTGRDNAYFLPLPDGVPSWSGMFLWEPINDAFEGPCRDGDFDAGVIEHEYAHGLSNRYVGTEELSLDAHQSGSMGEGWGDWYALNYLAREGYQNDSVLGAYVTGNSARGIRN